jgi:hypothetical protein
MEDRLFVSSLCFPLLLADFVNYLIALIKPAVFLVNLLTEFSVGFISLASSWGLSSPLRESNGCAIRLDIVNATIFAVYKAGRPFKLEKFT